MTGDIIILRISKVVISGSTPAGWHSCYCLGRGREATEGNGMQLVPGGAYYNDYLSPTYSTDTTENGDNVADRTR
jgi:hypothetical protein